VFPVLGLLAALLVTASPCPATPSLHGLPNYKPNAPVRSKLGTGHVLTGVVREAETCRPLTHARVELWQHGPEGYTRRWSATVFTDSAGRYRFEAPVPTAYRGARPHIHLRISLLGYAAIITVYPLRAGETRGRLDIALRRAQ
jgi:protocatechuate 3,4-dioxygenase beta subunit